MVRHGGRRQRPRQVNWDQEYGRSDGVMDRAPFFPSRGRAQAPLPNQPVPPRWNSRHTGPQSRSYVDVLRQDNSRPPRRWVFPRAGGSEVRRQPASLQFGKLVRKLHMVIKLVHHLQNVARKPGNPEPRMISKMVNVLSDMIKPAIPTQHTVDMITGNAKNWGHNTCLILEDHYKAGVEELLEELSSLLTQDWKAAFEVAVRWARRNLPRLSQEVVDHAEALITARTDTEETVQVRAPERTEVTVLNNGPRQTSAGVDTRDLGQTHIQPQGGVTVQTRLSLQPRSRNTMGTMTDRPEKQSDWPVNSPGPEAPKERRVRRRISTSFDVELEEIRPDEESEETEVPPPPTSIQVCAQVHREQTQQEVDAFEESFDCFVSPDPHKFRVNRHPNTQRKLTDWNLEVHKKWLIVGDSNLCSLPDYFSKNLQVESFPGSHFRHVQALMEKTVPPEDLVVEKIILSFGMNSRGNKSKETTIKNMQGALRSTKRKFPYADIWIPLVNFSQALTAEEKENLETLNEHIKRNMPFIPLLPENGFRTEADGVHWTAETGEAIFGHWMGHLDCGSP